jgi:hypothetical protein
MVERIVTSVFDAVFRTSGVSLLSDVERAVTQISFTHRLPLSHGRRPWWHA